ncbi:hypothetical protein ACLMJK_006874 [Lecanora helva]
MFSLLFLSFVAIVISSPLPESRLHVEVPPVAGQHTIHTTLQPKSFQKIDASRQQLMFEVDGQDSNAQPQLPVAVVVDVKADDEELKKNTGYKVDERRIAPA